MEGCCGWKGLITTVFLLIQNDQINDYLDKYPYKRFGKQLIQ